MKNRITGLLTMGAALLFGHTAHAQVNMKTLATSKEESHFVLAYKAYDSAGRKAAADSVVAFAKKNIPQSKAMRAELVQKMQQEKDVLKREQLFKQCVDAYPIRNIPGIFVVYDYMRAGIGAHYATEGNSAKAKQYADEMEYPFWAGEGRMIIANALLKKGDTATATGLVLKAVETGRAFVNPKPGDNEAQFAAVGYPYSNLMYANLMYRQGNYDTALVYMEEAARYNARGEGDYYLLHARILRALNKLPEAQAKLETSVITGKSNQVSLKELQEIYQLRNGNTSGFETYVAGLKNKMKAETKARVSKEMIDEPALAFALKDLNGNSVSLASLKGKVVVLDFWATWCGPCKASFPAMKKAQDKFKNDGKVQFLFIDCWERAEDYEELVKKYITSNKYDFSVLFDPKPAEGKSVAEHYGVTAIPAKFVIDGNGRIRFKMAGFTGGEEAAVEELSAMINMAKGSN
ncbi:TlpA disulfide reductase family protein [uncultured Chitinophaga sp.]|uniref:TlpA disulfide reductase family protein n=1 Tax=uncultured Chitinophaga sp. TaxID=339340 RepID=UPI0025D5FB78|nr:TlpA disulfide reductase family protein [uncultured Chitinophaga sp.]